MALSNALPNPTEWFRQWQRMPGESVLEDASSKVITAGSAAMLLIVLASLGVFVGVGTSIAQPLLELTVMLPLDLGEATVLPGLAMAAGVVAVLYSLQLQLIADERELYRDDINGIILSSAATMIIAGLQTTVAFTPTMVFALLSLGVLMLVLYGWRVVASR